MYHHERVHELQMGVSFQDGSPLSRFRVADGRIEMNTEVIMKTSGRQTVNLNISQPDNGIWTIQVDLRNQLGEQNIVHISCLLLTK